MRKLLLIILFLLFTQSSYGKWTDSEIEILANACAQTMWQMPVTKLMVPFSKETKQAHKALCTCGVEADASEGNTTPEEYLKIIGIENPVDQKKILEGNYPDNLTPEEYLKLYGINKTEKEYLANINKNANELNARYKKALKEIFPDDPQIFEKSVEKVMKCHKFAFEELHDKQYAEMKKKHPESYAEIERKESREESKKRYYEQEKKRMLDSLNNTEAEMQTLMKEFKKDTKAQEEQKLKEWEEYNKKLIQHYMMEDEIAKLKEPGSDKTINRDGAEFKKKQSALKKPGITGALDFLGIKTGLTIIFFESSNSFLQAEELLLKAYGKNVEAALVRAAIEYAKDSNNNESNRIKNSIKVTTEASKILEKEILDENKTISAEGKVFYAKSLPYTLNGTIHAIKLGPEILNTIQLIKSDLITAALQIAGFIKVVPQLPGYLKTINTTTKLVFAGAKANEIEGHKKFDKELGEIL